MKTMEKKKENNNKQAPLNHEPEANDGLNKEDQNKADVGHGRKKQQVGSPPNDNVASATQHYSPSVLQWPFTPQPIHKQSSSTPKPLVFNQQTTTVPINQWQTSLFTPLHQAPQVHQQNPINQHQHGPPPLQMNQSTGPVWLPPGPGFPVARATAAVTPYQPIVPMGTAEALTKNDSNIPSISYHGGYTHPMGFTGPWDPSSWWGQAQQSQPPCSYTLPGPYGYFPLPPTHSSVAFVTPHPRGVIQPQGKLSQKHQQMWEAQSSENVQLWAVISQMQAEMYMYGSRLMKLEAEVSSLKSIVGENPVVGVGAGTGLTGQTMKRGRPKKVTSTDVLPCLDESQPRARARKSVLPKVQSESKILHTEKESPNMDKGKSCRESLGTASIKQESNEISNLFTSNYSDFEITESNLKILSDVQATPSFHTQANRDLPGILNGGIGLNLAAVTRETDSSKSKEQKTTDFLFHSEHVKGAKSVENTSISYKETMTNGNHVWTTSIDNCSKNLLDIRSHAFYDNSNVIIQEGKFVPGWSFVQANASVEQEDMAVRSGKEDHEEREEDACSTGNEELVHKQGRCI